MFHTWRLLFVFYFLLLHLHLWDALFLLQVLCGLCSVAWVFLVNPNRFNRGLLLLRLKFPILKGKVNCIFKRVLRISTAIGATSLLRQIDNFFRWSLRGNGDLCDWHLKKNWPLYSILVGLRTLRHVGANLLSNLQRNQLDTLFRKAEVPRH